MRQEHGFGTRSVHAGDALDPTTGAFGVPIDQNTTYGFRSYDQLVDWREGGVPHFSSLRDGHPIIRSLEVKRADLEGAEAAVAGASGMAVISATLLHLVPAGGALIASADIYTATRDFIGEELAARGATARFVDCADVAAVAVAITPQTCALYTEVFTNPTLCVADLAALGALARERGLPLIVDNTFLSPALLRPLEYGATALRLATLLAAHPAVATINYPGLPGVPGHATATALVGGRYGGMLSFTLHGGQEATRTVLNALELCTLAVSLGECGSLIWPFEESACAGMPTIPPLLRLSVGIEDTDDLEAEFVRALGVLAVSVSRGGGPLRVHAILLLHGRRVVMLRRYAVRHVRSGSELGGQMSGRSTDDDDAIPEGARDRFGGPTMTIDEVAQLYGVPAAILRRAIERGDLSLAATADGQEALSRAAVLTWLKRRRAGWA